MFIGLFLIIGIVGVLIYNSDWRPQGTLSTAQAANGNAPLDIAKARYARGELTKEEFEQIRYDLS